MNVIERILNKSEILETERTKIYPIKLENDILRDLWEIYSDAENVNGFSQKYLEIEDFVHVMLDKINRHQNELFGFIGYIIEHKESGKIIGIRNIILDGVYNYQNKRMDNNENVTAEIVINKNYWRQHYAKECSTAIFDYLANNGVKKIGAFIHNNHFGSKNMCENMGFIEVDDFEFTNIYGFNRDHEILHSGMSNPILVVKNLN